MVAREGIVSAQKRTIVDDQWEAHLGETEVKDSSYGH